MKIKIKIKKLSDNYDYRMEHTAPSEKDSPLYDMTLNNIFPKSIYEELGKGYYGDASLERYIYSFKNKKYKKLKIYRAVPLTNEEIEIKKIKKQITPLIIEYWEKLILSPKEIEERQIKISNYNDQIKSLKKLNKSITKINSGDWVTLTLSYAKEHGESNLNEDFKILTKTVAAKNVFNDGNSLEEWGYIENV
jgi:hypothetical protein